MIKQLLHKKALQFLQMDSCKLGSVNENLAVLLVAKKYRSKDDVEAVDQTSTLLLLAFRTHGSVVCLFSKYVSLIRVTWLISILKFYP